MSYICVCVCVFHWYMQMKWLHPVVHQSRSVIVQCVYPGQNPESWMLRSKYSSSSPSLGWGEARRLVKVNWKNSVLTSKTFCFPTHGSDLLSLWGSLLIGPSLPGPRKTNVSRRWWGSYFHTSMGLRAPRKQLKWFVLEVKRPMAASKSGEWKYLDVRRRRHSDGEWNERRRRDRKKKNWISS